MAQQLGSPALAGSVRTAFVAGMDDASRVAAIIAAVALVGTLVLLPRRSSAAAGDGAVSEAEATGATEPAPVGG